MDWWAFVSALHASCVDKAGLVSHEVFKRVDLRDRFFFFFFGYNARGFRRFGTIEAIPPETDGWPAHRFWFKGLLRGSRRSRQLACATKLQLKYFRDASTIYETQPFYIYIYLSMIHGVYLGIMRFDQRGTLIVGIWMWNSIGNGDRNVGRQLNVS